MDHRDFNLQRLRALLDLSALRSEAELTRLHRFFYFWVLVVRSFNRNRCPIRASALSYTTLLALIPMLAVAMSVTSLFLKSEGEERIEAAIQVFVDRMIPAEEASANPTPAEAMSAMSGMTPPPASAGAAGDLTNSAAAAVAEAAATNAVAVPDQRLAAGQRKAAQYIHSFIENTYSGTLGVTGMVFLLLTAIMTLTRIEEAFNDIWGVPRGRDWLARVVNYFSTITLGPVLLFGALGLAGGSHFQKTRELITALPLMEPLISKVLPLVLICFSFAMFYKLVPNTKVHWNAALVGGALAGTLWHSYNLLSFLLASRAVSASRVYGSFALVPLFMGGLYVVWLIVLFGAQVAYAVQNRDAYLQERLVENVNQRGREFVALRLMTCIGQRFQRGLPPASVPEMSRELGIPSKLVQQILHTLLSARLVLEISRGEPAYAPARPLETISAHQVLEAMRALQGQDLLTRDEPAREEVYGEFTRIQEAERQVASSVTMLALVQRSQTRLELNAGLQAGPERKPAA